MTLKFSVITVSYNHAEFIRTTIDSVLAQKYPSFEHIIVDGGSTDNTIEILKSYPHLVWSSEKDRGISHALNKGFKKATGDVIAWINSDDWYAPEIFSKVAPLLENNAVVLGNAVQTDRAGTPSEKTNNVARSYYDLLRYWIPRGWLAQPAVFFRRDSLESVRLPNGDYIDESFGYSMDYDLWLRLGEKYPFATHLDSAFAYFRVYGENKTGRVFATPQRELGRAFRASISRRRECERKITFAIPILELGENLKSTIHSLVSQELKDIEVLFVDCLAAKEDSAILKEVVQSIEECTTLTTFRVLKSVSRSYSIAVDEALRDARCPIVCVLRPGDVAETSLTTELINYFAHDPHGAAFISGPNSTEFSNLGDPSNHIVVPNTILSLETTFQPFAVRKIVYEELLNFHHEVVSDLSQRSFLLRALNRGWLIVDLDKPLLSKDLEQTKERKTFEKLMQQFTKAQLILDGFNDSREDIFHGTRSLSPYAPTYPKDNVDMGKKLLTYAPKELGGDLNSLSVEDLESLTNSFPAFVPAWFILRERYIASRETDKANHATQTILNLRGDISLS